MDYKYIIIVLFIYSTLIYANDSDYKNTLLLIDYLFSTNEINSIFSKNESIKAETGSNPQTITIQKEISWLKENIFFPKVKAGIEDKYKEPPYQHLGCRESAAEIYRELYSHNYSKFLIAKRYGDSAVIFYTFPYQLETCKLIVVYRIIGGRELINKKDDELIGTTISDILIFSIKKDKLILLESRSKGHTD
jgi:hypothetical protein